MSIVWKDSQPNWDFAEVTAFPVQITQGNQKIPVNVYMSPYSSKELREILKKAVSGYIREKQDVEIVREDKAVYTPLCDAHFVKLGNSTGTPEAQRAWLDKRAELKPEFVELTFGGLQMDLPKDDAPEGEEGMLDIGLEFSEEVAVYQNLYDERDKKVVRVDMVHSYKHPTEKQFREYRSARRNKFTHKSALWTMSEQHATLEKLYDEVIVSIKGACVNGVPCVPVSSVNWIEQVPLWHKLFIVDRIFGAIIEKND